MGLGDAGEDLVIAQVCAEAEIAGAEGSDAAVVAFEVTEQM